MPVVFQSWWTDMSLTLISSTVLGVSAANFDITNIPATYDHLMVVFMSRFDGAGGSPGLMRFNNDSAANYDDERLFGNDAAAPTDSTNAGATSMRFCNVIGTNTAANYMGLGFCVIPNYARTTFYKGILSFSHEVEGAGPTRQLGFHGGQWKSTAAVNRITLLPPSGNFIAGSVVFVYGIV